MTVTPEKIEAAKAIYKTLLHLERHLVASPEPDPEALRLVKRLHKLLNKMRLLIAPELTWQQFLSLIDETPVESADAPEDPEGNDTGNKDKPQDPENP